MEYIPIKKILTEKYSETQKAEEIINYAFEKCYIISFETTIQTNNSFSRNPFYHDIKITYFIIKENNKIFAVSYKLAQDESMEYSLLINEIVFTYWIELGLGSRLIGNTLRKYFLRKIKQKIFINSFIPNRYEKILQEYLKT